MVSETVGSNTDAFGLLESECICYRLPEFCVVLPTGEVIDFEQYGETIPLPAETPQDETATISAMLTIQFEDPPIKRSRTDAS